LKPFTLTTHAAVLQYRDGTHRSLKNSSIAIRDALDSDLGPHAGWGSRLKYAVGCLSPSSAFNDVTITPKSFPIHYSAIRLSI